MGHIQIAEARVRAVPAQTDNARLAVAVFGYDALGLKIMAKELNVPVIALSQLSRAAEKTTGRSDHRPQLSDLHGTAGKAMTGTFSSLAMILRFRVMSLISCTRLSVRLALCINCR